MKAPLRLLFAAAIVLKLSAFVPDSAQARPYEDDQFKGRIAYSADGNHNDPDDWAASPLALAILAEAGLRDRLVHFDYNSILPLTNPEWERVHADAVLGAAARYGYDLSLFFDDRQDLDGAIASIVRAVNDSSADDPLYFIIAGPVEVPYRAMKRAEPSKLQYVFCISHSQWNDGLVPHYEFRFTKRDVIEMGVHWVQIRDQNQLLSSGRFGTPAKQHEFAQYFWLRDSPDPKVRFLWNMMVASTRPDPSDAGMVWFLATGDEECTPGKLRSLLEDRQPLTRVPVRTNIRLEAESFRHVQGLAVDQRNDRSASQGSAVRLDGVITAQMRTSFHEPFANPAASYDVEVRYLDEAGVTTGFEFYVNGKFQGAGWKSSGAGVGWVSHMLRDIKIRIGDELRLDISGASGAIDFVQLSPPGAAPTPAAVPRLRANIPAASLTGTPEPMPIAALDDPNAMPGGLIVAGGNPGYLKYNAGRAVFLSGPDNPETFLYLGTAEPDGTRSGGRQEEIIERLARVGLNAFHFIMWRMHRSNLKDEGDDTHSPFIDHDPSKALNEQVLRQWENWLTALERSGVNVLLEFYDDATDVRKIGWDVDQDGNLHPDEERWITGIVQRFKHHRNILWSPQESLNKLQRSRVPYFRKLAELIANVDNYNHPIVASFVVPDDPEGDDHPDHVGPDDFLEDPNISVVTWLHVHRHGADLERQYQEYLKYQRRDAANFIVMKNETFQHPRNGPLSRRYMWSAAMAGLHSMEAYHDADPWLEPARRRSSDDTLRDDARISAFMEQTDFYRMRPMSEMAASSTKWVLGNPGESYIAYTYEYEEGIGLRTMPAGIYDLMWFDTESGMQVVQEGLAVGEGFNVTWMKPDGMGNELALYIKRVAAPAKPVSALPIGETDTLGYRCCSKGCSIESGDFRGNEASDDSSVSMAVAAAEYGRSVSAEPSGQRLPASATGQCKIVADSMCSVHSLSPHV